MLANHIHDRSALLPVTLKFGMDVQTQIACDEWMSTSPIYNHRNRQFLKIEGDDVSVALKGLQVDIGAPHNYLNFHYELVSPVEGFFWTSTCGPFNHVYRMSGGDESLQTQICHHMEDPTFDATVMAVNPQMRCRPIFPPTGCGHTGNGTLQVAGSHTGRYRSRGKLPVSRSDIKHLSGKLHF